MASELTSQQRNDLQSYQAITNQADEGACIRMLKDHGWNLEAAVATTLAIGDHLASDSRAANTSSFSSSPLSSSSSSPTDSKRSSSSSSSSAARPILTGSTIPAVSSSSVGSTTASSSSATVGTTTSGMPIAHAVTPLPGARQAAAAATGTSGVFGLLGSTVRWLASWLEPPAEEKPSGPYSEDFKRAYPTAPIFFPGSYMEAVRHARAHGRLLFVYLHAPAHDDTPAFCRDVLCNPAVVTYLHDNFIPFVSDIKQSEGYQLQGMLMAGGFPFIATLAPQATTEGAVVMVMKHHGSITSDALIARLLPCVEAHRVSVRTTTTRQVQQSSSRSLIEQQDREFMEMEAMDRRKREAAAEEEKRHTLERETKQREEEEISKKAAEEEAIRQAALLAEEAKRATKSAQLPDEPAAAAGPGIATISVRLPAGTKISRRFFEVNTLQSVYDWIDCNDLVTSDGDRVVRYTLLSNFPRHEHSDRSATISSLRLGRQVMLTVEQLLDDQNDNDAVMQQEPTTS